MSETVAKQPRCVFSEMSELYLYINDISNFIYFFFFAKLDNGFRILEENFLDFLSYSRYNGYGHDTLFYLNCIINIVSSTFLSLEPGLKTVNKTKSTPDFWL